MDWIYINKYLPLFVEASLLTLRIAIIGIVCALLIGLFCSILQYYKVPILRKLASCYIELSRNTPLLVQLFFIYFGLPKIGIVLDSETCGIIGLSFLGGSYMAEAFRSGLESVDNIQFETGLSIGLTLPQIMWYIVMPQALSVSVPAICANIIFLIKETSVFSAVALADLVYMAKDLIGLYYQTDETLLMLVLSYLIILLPISIVSTIVERRIRYASFGN